MIANNTVQAAIVSWLLANSTITGLLDDAEEVREAQWQGTTFTYPNIRVALGTQVPLGDIQCGLSRVPFAIMVFSEKASSQQADNIAGAVNSELYGKAFTRNGVRFSAILNTGLVSAFRQDRNTWRAEANFLATIQSG